jgi:hypothetical protein
MEKAYKDERSNPAHERDCFGQQSIQNCLSLLHLTTTTKEHHMHRLQCYHRVELQ